MARKAESKKSNRTGFLQNLLARFFRPKSIWIRGEDAATKLMKQTGYKILARNLKLSMGEIDILCFDQKSDCVIIVEVKARTRKSSATPMPESSITHAKKKKLRTLAHAIKSRKDCRDKRIRIDVVAVEFLENQKQPIDIRHYQSAVGAA